MTTKNLVLIVALTVTGCAGLPLRGDHEPQERSYHSRYAEDGFVPGSGGGAITLMGPGSTSSTPTFTGGASKVIVAIAPGSGCYGMGGTVVGQACNNAAGWTIGSDGASFINFYYGNQIRMTGSQASGDWTTPYNWIGKGFQATATGGQKALDVTVNGAIVDFGAGASDQATSDGTTVTFAGPVSVTGVVNANNGIAATTVTLAGASGSLSVVGVTMSRTAPTISSGFGTSPSIATNNGTAGFTVNVGTGGVATSGVIGLPTATNGWVCSCDDLTQVSTSPNKVIMTAASTTTCTVTNKAMSTGAAAAWAASDILHCTATGR